MTDNYELPPHRRLVADEYWDGPRQPPAEWSAFVVDGLFQAIDFIKRSTAPAIRLSLDFLEEAATVEQIPEGERLPVLEAGSVSVIRAVIDRRVKIELPDTPDKRLTEFFHLISQEPDDFDYAAELLVDESQFAVPKAKFYDEAAQTLVERKVMYFKPSKTGKNLVGLSGDSLEEPNPYEVQLSNPLIVGGVWSERDKFDIHQEKLAAAAVLHPYIETDTRFLQS